MIILGIHPLSILFLIHNHQIHTKLFYVYIFFLNLFFLFYTHFFHLIWDCVYDHFLHCSFHDRVHDRVNVFWVYDCAFNFRVCVLHNDLHVYVHAYDHACGLCAHAYDLCAHVYGLCAHACDLCAHAYGLCAHACVHHINRHACALYYGLHVHVHDESNYGFHEA